MLIVNKSIKNFITRTAEDNKVSGLLNHVLQKEGHALVNTNEINYLTFGKDGTVEYSLDNKELFVTENFEILPKNRQTGKPSKIFRKIIKKECLHLFNEKDFENFANLFKSKGLNSDLKFEIIDGVDIHNTYYMQLDKQGGSLAKSCMNKTIRMFGIYVGNPQVCKMVRLINTKKNTLCGRAILWTLPNGDTFLDRVYTTEDFYLELFFEFALENSVTYRKREQTHTSQKEFVKIATGEYINTSFTIELNTDFNKSPYLDTFRYGKRGVISNDSEGYNDYTYASTEGGRNNKVEDDSIYPSYEADTEDLEEGMVLTYDGDMISTEDAVTINGNVYDTNSDDVVYCEYHGEYSLTDETTYCEDISSYVNDNAYTVYYSESDDCYYYSDDSLTEINGGYYDSDDCVEVEGEWYLKSSDDIIETSDGEYILTEDAVEVEGEWYSSDSPEIVVDYDGDYILREDAVEVNGDTYHMGNDLIIEDCEGNYILTEDSVEIGSEVYYKYSELIREVSEGVYELID